MLYLATRKDAEWYSNALCDEGIPGEAYHAGMVKAHRDAVHRGFRDDEFGVIVATSAFGMGIDKPKDLRSRLGIDGRKLTNAINLLDEAGWFAPRKRFLPKKFSAVVLW